MAKKASRFKVDRKKIIGLFGKVNTAVYEWYGADVKSRAKRSIKNPTKSRPQSKPGEPPVSQTGTLKNLIHYELDPVRGVVIGPVQFKGRSRGAKALEYGGPTTYKHRGRRRRTRIKARPFMRPAAGQVQKTLPEKYKRARLKYWK